MKIALTLWILVFAAGCDDFLSEPPDNRTTLDSSQKIAQLLVNAYSGAQYAEFAEAMTDNVEDKGPAASRNHEIIREAYQWQNIDLTTEDSPAYYWQKGYEAIAHANQALASMEALGADQALNPQKGEALLARAYAHFMLLNIFSLHYDPATAAAEPGIPYVTSPEKNAVRRYKRASIEQVYDAVERDINEGLPLVRDNYKKSKFHFTPEAANAFAARFYLWRGQPEDWQKVIAHADEVLGSTPSPSSIRDRSSGAYQALSFDQTAIQHSSSEEASNLLITWGYSTIDRRFRDQRYGLGLSTQKVEELFETRRLGRVTPVGNPFDKRWGYKMYNRKNGLHNYHPKFYEFFNTTNPSAGTGFPYTAVVHLTIDEVLLNRAEAYAMLDEFDKASADLTLFLSRKTRDFEAENDKITPALMREKYPRIPGEYTPYYALGGDQAAFVKGVAELRRREFLHEAMRWFDIKRFNILVKHPVHESDTLVLEKNDPRRAVQIPQFAQDFGIKPNPE